MINTTPPELPASPRTTIEYYDATEYSATEGIIEAFVLTIICVVATGGNIAFWYVICADVTLRTTSNVLLLCLSSADILVSVVDMPIAVATILNHGWPFSDTVCVAVGFLNMITFIASVMSLATISINRYILVCRPIRFKTTYTKKNVAAMIMGVWLLALSLAAPPLFGWGTYGYLSGQTICFCQWRSSISYTFFMVGVCFGGPCSVMSFCYYKIMSTYRSSQRRVRTKQDGSISRTSDDPKLAVVTPHQAGGGEAVNNQRARKKRQRKEEEKKLTKSLLVVIFVFVVCWLPFCITMFWSVFTSYPVPRVPDVISLLLGFMNSGCNPIIYGVMNHRFRQGFMRLMKCKCFDRVSRRDSGTVVSMAPTRATLPEPAPGRTKDV